MVWHFVCLAGYELKSTSVSNHIVHVIIVRPQWADWYMWGQMTIRSEK